MTSPTPSRSHDGSVEPITALPHTTSALSVENTVVLFAGGDVLLRTEQGPTDRFLVSSVLLAHASPVFKAMFHGDFAEGQGLSEALPELITLADPPQALETLLRMIHHRPPTVHWNPGPEEILALINICDKYDCVSVIGWFRQTWFDSSMHKWSFKQSSCMLAAAVTLRLPSMFRNITRRLILHYPECLSQITVEVPNDSWIVPRAIYYMEQQRQTLREDIRLKAELLDSLEYPCGCKITLDRSKLSALLRILDREALETSARRLASIALEADFEPSERCQTHDKKSLLKAKEQQRVCGKIRFSREPTTCLVTGLCLHCYVDGSPEMGACKDHTVEENE
ncbi:hypothetical protein K461DRAFT_322864 [Myriangium duriaei CBS 260.36]|uniref:BTB domain-containing protein n=1 Tax=Myriangium duriaei CBS 260.36 TaxID=1168546 RepID=A0A9P4MDV5_9PEZI|nr:hypothetical protein K461DRAFT_322864 [Myriangium duriaei CBS 260.36]